MGDEGVEGHPVDDAVERRLDHAVLRRRIRAATDRLMEALGEEQDLWLRVEELLGEQRLDREAAYFDIGYAHGRAAGRGEALADGKPRASAAYRELARRIREAAVNASLPPGQAASALIEAAWGLAVDGSAAATRRAGLRGNREREGT
jgi:hypothetical protein